jgi:hypothetical protein
MILYYTATQKTKVFAEALHDVLGLPTYELKTELGKKIGFGFIIKSLYLALSGNPYPVDNIPANIDAAEIYLCAPVWGGRIAAPGLFFLQNADLKGKKVHLLLTCESITGVEKYKENALVLLDKLRIAPGTVYVMATGKTPPDRDTVAEQLREMLPDNTE